MAGKKEEKQRIRSFEVYRAWGSIAQHEYNLRLLPETPEILLFLQILQVESTNVHYQA